MVEMMDNDWNFFLLSNYLSLFDSIDLFIIFLVCSADKISSISGIIFSIYNTGDSVHQLLQLHDTSLLIFTCSAKR
ncbi:hypothetical protein ASPFODRAFT_649221 [Aspergillus luchuensis CBS 106.47]|uniref:Uncharacterized protein n=1 Tax=Aspergillus luchuensis (strain CBS 106.47) TaxID=1137211 RepID=A0A1M3TDX7_ASPLC|nr:hypothetical protein ASPFODRAFT_649221 [Aspergillus luchuensis CBS 106.47]